MSGRQMMKIREIQKILRGEILPHLNGWQICDRFAYLPEPGDILRGVYLAGSSSPTVVYVEAFVMPLYVPTDTINFSLSKRLKESNGWERWSVDAAESRAFARDLLAAIDQDGMAWLARFASPKLVIKQLSESVNFHDKQVFAYSLAYIGNAEAAIKCLTEVAEEAEEDVSVSPWLKPIGERAKHLVELLHEGPEVAKAQLSKWVDETRKVLNLPVRQVNLNGHSST
ncbi:MAG: hypothetical protein M3O30_19515 [Planctomycetota bacterium]|nr:hypothetical protein [Planctomycetota bacterium]